MRWVWLLPFFALACSEGTTPDCTKVMCGPDLDGSIIDVQSESSTDATTDAATTDAPSDAGADGPNDAANDAPNDAPSSG